MDAVAALDVGAGVFVSLWPCACSVSGWCTCVSLGARDDADDDADDGLECACGDEWMAVMDEE